MRASSLLTTALAAAVCITPVALAPALGGSSFAATPTVYGGIWTADPGANAIRGYAPGANGAATATAVISGANTGLHAPSAVAVGGGGTIFVVNSGNDSITEYAATATGDATPLRTIIGSHTGLASPAGISLWQGQVWVTDPATDTVEAFTAGDSGNVLPAETIAGSQTGLDNPVAVSVNEGIVEVLNTPTAGPASIGVYLPLGLIYGNLAPLVSLTGTKTRLVSPTTIAAAPDLSLWVNDTANNSVSLVNPLFGSLVGGGSAPIKGAATGLNDPDGIAVDAAGDLLVANAGDHTLRVFKRNASGNTAPIRTITAVGTPAAVTVLGTRPGAPTDLKVAIHGNSAKLSWKPPTVTGGGIIDYQVTSAVEGGAEEIINIGGDSGGEGGLTKTTTKTTITIPHLKNGRPYFFAVFAVNGFGESNPSNLVHFFISTPPSAPLHVVASARSEGFAVHWKPPASTGGRPVSHYIVDYATCVPDTKNCAVSSRTVSGKARHAVVRALSPSQVYNVRVIAQNAAGESIASKDVKVTTRP